MPENPFDAALRDVERLSDPTERLRVLAGLREMVGDADRDLRRLLREVIVELRGREPRATWPEIGEILGVSAQRAEQLSK